MRGFSLVEAMVTLAIIGSLFALALPRLKPTLNKVADAQEISQVVDALRHAQRLAIDSQCTLQLSTQSNMLVQTQLCPAPEAPQKLTLFSLPLTLNITLLPTGRSTQDHHHCVNQACFSVTQSGDILRQITDADVGEKHQ